jgi:hypothetical protein
MEIKKLNLEKIIINVINKAKIKYSRRETVT